MYVCVPCVQCPWRAGEGSFPGTGITDGCEPPCRCWRLNQVLWKNHQCSEQLDYFSSPFNFYF